MKLIKKAYKVKEKRQFHKCKATRKASPSPPSTLLSSHYLMLSREDVLEQTLFSGQAAQ
jgi:hypothetical protein